MKKGCTCKWGYVLCYSCKGYGTTKEGEKCTGCNGTGKVWARIKINPACPQHGKDKSLMG